MTTDDLEGVPDESLPERPVDALVDPVLDQVPLSVIVAFGILVQLLVTGPVYWLGWSLWAVPAWYVPAVLIAVNTSLLAFDKLMRGR